MIGYVGHKFFKGYLFKIDYLHRKITFYKNSSERITSSKSKGAVIRSGTDSYGDTLLTVKNIVLDGKFKTALRGVESTLFKDTRTIRKELEITEANLMTIGYPFMSQYKTVWDYARKKIYILEY